MKILFIGTVKMSANFLNEMIRLNKNIVGIFSLKKSNFNSDFVDLKPIAEKSKIPFFYSENINDKSEEEIIKSLKPDYIFCFGWSKILSEKILSIPTQGTIGFHPAQLPFNRGRHPIIWALILGLKQTASTFYFMDKNIDSGKILDQKIINISNEDNASSLYKRINDVAVKQLNDFIPKLEKGTFILTKQNEKIANSWRKRSAKDGIIDWRMSSASIYNLVRGLSRPYVGADFYYNEKKYKVWDSKIFFTKQKNIEPGKVIKKNDQNLVIKTGTDAIEIKEMEPKLNINIGEYL